VARYYLKLAQTKTPAQMEALIWGEVSGDGTDHGPTCAAFASLTLELAAQTTGLRSWVTGGASYPWPLPTWADVRVDTSPASPQIISVVADAQAHGRWHPLGDGYLPQPGDWAVYDGHVAVVTGYSGGVLDTIAADSLPGLTVNAHSSAAPLADQGLAGFVDNGNLQLATGDTSGQAVKTAPQSGNTAPANAKAAPAKAEATAAAAATAVVPGLPDAVALAGTGGIPGAGPAVRNGGTGEPATAAVPGVLATGQLLGKPAASITPRPKSPTSAPANARPSPAEPAQSVTPTPAASPSPASSSPKQYATPGTRNQQAFISLVAPGAVAAQQRSGVPASVTIAQAIEESAWGQSSLAARTVRRLPQRRRVHRRPHGAPRHQRLLRPRDGRPRSPGRVRQRPHRRLRHRPRLRRQPHRPDEALQPLPVRHGPGGRARRHRGPRACASQRPGQRQHPRGHFPR